MSTIAINPSVPPVAVQGVTADVILQPGTVISAEVQQILGNDQVQISTGGQSIVVASQIPLQAGQTLELSVSQAPDGSIQLAVVNLALGTAGQAIADLASADLTADLVALTAGTIANLAAPTPAVAVVALNQLTPPEALAVTVAAQAAATRQTSLAPLFADLSVAAGVNGLPAQVQQAVAQVLAQRTSLDPSLTGAAIKQAFQSSGLFLEASLASGSAASSAAPDLKAALIVLRQVLTTSLGDAAPTPGAQAPTTLVQPTTPAQPAAPAQPATATQPDAVVPNAVASAAIEISSLPVTIAAEPVTPTAVSPPLAPLLMPESVEPELLLQGTGSPLSQGASEFGAANAVISTPATAAAAVARAAVSNAALNLLQEAVQATPLSSLNPSSLGFDEGQSLSWLPAVTGARLANVDDGVFARTNLPPPPLSGALPAAQPVLPATLLSNWSPQAAMQHLLADTEGALARQTLLQVASLPDRVDPTVGHIDPTAPRWNFEIPFVTAQGTAMAQFEISRDGNGSEVEAAKRIWRARFSLDVEPAGPVHALISLSGERTSVRMWAERPATAEQLRAGIPQLSQAL
ncbi:MAG TPA: flagellar hook-length control protein FliK, partial [Bradyrhizobium sp.]